MKKRLIIAGAVAGYLIIESFVFFLYSFVAFNGVEQAVIVSTLGLCAALVYGNRPSPTKALTIVCIVIGFLPVWLGPVSLMAYLLGLLYGTPENALTNLIVFAILGWTVTIVVVVKVTRKLHRRRIPGEADHWLAERAKYRDNARVLASPEQASQIIAVASFCAGCADALLLGSCNRRP